MGAGKRFVRSLFLVFAVSALGMTTASAVVVGDPNPCVQFAQSASTVEANLAVGSASTSISIEVPPGQNGMTPKLALTYNSSGGPSLYGIGWDLAIGQIRRSQRKGLLTCADVHFNELNEYVLSIGGETVEFYLNGLTGPDGFAHIEESFFKIFFHNGSGPGNYWEVWDRSGNRYVFGRYERWSESPQTVPRTGSTTQHGLEPVCNTGKLTQDLRYTATWELTRIEDTHGNWIDIQYEQVGGGVRPEFIEYGGNRTAHNSPRYQVDFIWEPRGPEDYSPNFRTGALVELRDRLAEIEVRRYLGNSIRKYVFDYEHEVSVPDRVARANLLSRVTLHGKDGAPLKRHDASNAAREYFYDQITPTSAGLGRLGPQVASKAQPRPGIDDLNVARLVTTADQPTFADPGGHLVRTLIDMNGDGLLDLVDTWELNGGEYEGSGCESTSAGAPAQWRVYKGRPNGFDNLNPLNWVSPTST